MSTQEVKARLKLRNDAEADWISQDPVLLKGELVLVKIGDVYYTKIGENKKFSQTAYNQFNPSNFRGIAHPTDNPGTQTDTPAYWIATEPGTYTNFGGVVINASSFGFIGWTGSAWIVSQSVINLTDYAKKTDLDKKQFLAVSIGSGNISIDLTGATTVTGDVRIVVGNTIYTAVAGTISYQNDPGKTDSDLSFLMFEKNTGRIFLSNFDLAPAIVDSNVLYLAYVRGQNLTTISKNISILTAATSEVVLANPDDYISITNHQTGQTSIITKANFLKSIQLVNDVIKGTSGYSFDLDPSGKVYQDVSGTIPATETGQSVARVDDKAGMYNATQASAPNRPVFITNAINGLPALRWPDNTPRSLVFTQALLDNAHTVFMVVKINTVNQFANFITSSTVRGLVYGIDDSNPPRVSLQSGSFGTQASSHTLPASEWAILCIRGGGLQGSFLRDGRFDTSVGIRKNGVESTGSNLTMSGLLKSTGGTVIGYPGFATADTQVALKADIARIIIYNRSLSLAEVKNIESNLGAKYNISVTNEATFTGINPLSFSGWNGNDIPVIGRTPNTIEDYVEVPSVFVENGKYYLYYTGWNAARNDAHIFAAVGNRADSLTKVGAVLSAGGTGFEGGAYVHASRMHKFGNTYYLYFTESKNKSFEGDPSVLYVATANNPLGPFTKNPTPLLAPNPSGWDDLTIYRPWVIFYNNKYHLFYNAKQNPFPQNYQEAIGHAISDAPDQPFTRVGTAPVVEGDASLGISRIGDPSVFPDGAGGFLMLYFGQNDPYPASFAIATSQDLTTWTKYPNSPGWAVSSGAPIRLAPFLDPADGKWKAYADNIPNNIYLLVNDKQ